MSDPWKAERSLNPLLFYFHNLDHEPKCFLCLNLLSKSTLLPCNHFLCNVCIPDSSQFSADCPLCQQQFTDQSARFFDSLFCRYFIHYPSYKVHILLELTIQIRPAPYMDNLVAIYKNLYAVFSCSTLLPMFSQDNRSTPVSISSSAGQLRKELGEIALKKKAFWYFIGR